jgi:predicted histone-like DNA-binding protein
MAIKYKVVQRGQPGVTGGGTKKFYPQVVYTKDNSLDDLTVEIEKISTVSGADIRAVLYALVDVCLKKIGDSEIVRIGELGSLRVSIGGKGEAAEDKVLAGSITRNRIVYAPGPKLKAMLKGAKYGKA